ncbi:MAG: NAD(P)-dependent dehydrogenase (short-subunit alcohol dehydrogenase family) [Halioglobus sp.]
MPLLKNKVALVTGAGAGIGRGIARAFARAGAKVVVAEFDSDSGKQVAEELAGLGSEGWFVHTDIMALDTVVAAVEKTVEHWGTIDIVVNNAYPTMVYGPAKIEAIDQQRLRDSMTAGFFAVSAAMRAAYPVMKENGSGRVINICSLNGVNAHKYTADYNSAKEAVRAYTRTAAVEWAADGITANIICPGAATTPYQYFKDAAPDMAREIEKSNPMGYMGDPENDIAPVAVFLASEMSRYMTGNTLYVDGGGHINGVPWSPTLS